MISTKNNKNNQIIYQKAIYKSKHLKINTFPREIILSITAICYINKYKRLNSNTDSIVYSAKHNNKSETLIPEWYKNKYKSETPMNNNNQISETGNMQYSNGNIDEKKRRI